VDLGPERAGQATQLEFGRHQGGPRTVSRAIPPRARRILALP